ncbi:MAG: hypothetical protein DLM72_07450 [Candidatus Nitrosopolaris wilkensis]|nr:MAG: hypothetical protein DLM72_07450 [Candidatus Nitrosopolaris wilkensis]
MYKISKLSLMVILAIAIATMMIPGAPVAFASNHHHHYNHVTIHQEIIQANACDKGASCHNTAQNNASVDLPHHSSNNVHISQQIDQANLCSGQGTSCSNTAQNNASVS